MTKPVHRQVDLYSFNAVFKQLQRAEVDGGVEQVVWNAVHHAVNWNRWWDVLLEQLQNG